MVDPRRGIRSGYINDLQVVNNQRFPGTILISGYRHDTQHTVAVCIKVPRAAARCAMSKAVCRRLHLATWKVI